MAEAQQLDEHVGGVLLGRAGVVLDRAGALDLVVAHESGSAELRGGGPVDDVGDDRRGLGIHEPHGPGHAVALPVQSEGALRTAPRLALRDARDVEFIAQFPGALGEPVDVERIDVGEELPDRSGERVCSDAVARDAQPASDRGRLLGRQRAARDTLGDVGHPRSCRHRHLTRRGLGELRGLDEECADLDARAGIPQGAARRDAYEFGGRTMAAGRREPPQPQLRARPRGDLAGDERLLSLHRRRLTRDDARELQQLVITEAAQPRGTATRVDQFEYMFEKKRTNPGAHSPPPATTS